MSTAPMPSPAPRASEAEVQALREEVARLRAQQAATADQQAKGDKYEQSQVRFRTVFEQSPLGHKIIDANLVIRQANPAVVAMLGLARPEELVGRRILEFAHPEFRADWHYLQERLWTHRLPKFSLITCLVRADGSSFWCQVTSILFQDEDGELGYTTLENIDEQQALAESLKRVYDTQENILHLVAHDMKAPVANIQLLVELLRRTVAGPDGVPAGDPAKTTKYLALIEQSCAEAIALLKDVLYLGELDASRLEKQPTNLNTFLSAQLAVHRVAAQQKGVDLVLELPAEPLQAPLNPARFGRVMANLLTNALKFTPGGGRVVVRLEADEGRPRLTVQDTGVGIPAALQIHLFDKFSAASRTGLAGESTTGLGLFITQQIVRLHGGTIRVESREQEGTTFFIDLP